MRYIIVILFVAAIAALTYANKIVIGYQSATTFELSDLPVVKACLVLGTAKYLADGRHNQFYSYRMAAAHLVYSAGKCTKIVVSGDNRTPNYNEPEQMKRSLVELGIPSADIYCDYAGGRTLDSVIRFKHIFGQSAGIVISQQFHNARAIYIGQAHAIDLVGFNAKDPDAFNGARTKIREVFSRLRAVLDVEFLNSKPRHLGAPVVI